MGGDSDGSLNMSTDMAPMSSQCGNGVCEPGETQACADCPATPGTCNDGTCNFGETSTSCPADCKPLRAGGMALRALPDLTTGSYKGYRGGLYPNSSNTMPADHLAAGQAQVAMIRPLDVAGTSDPANGKIVLISVGMSNTTQEFCHHDGVNNALPAACNPWSFSGRARDDAAVEHGKLILVNGARGGMSIENWVTPPVAHTPTAPAACAAYANPNNATYYPATAAGQAEKAGVFGSNGLFDEEYDRVNACNLKANGLSFRQVQVAWVKLSRADAGANMLPDANADAYNLKRDLGNVMRSLKARYPNLRVVFLSSRVWGGFSGSTTAEPYAFETGFAVKWLIEAQINQLRNGGVSTENPNAPGYSGDLNYATGVAPLVAWGPYLWANYNQPTSGDATWFGDVGSTLYAGTLAGEMAAPTNQMLTLPPANASTYYTYCGPGTGAAMATTPGPQSATLIHRWCDSDFYTLLQNGGRANSAFPAQYGWSSDSQQEDGTHPLHDGEAKVGSLLLRFFKGSPLASCWFLAGRTCP